MRPCCWQYFVYTPLETPQLCWAKIINRIYLTQSKSVQEFSDSLDPKGEAVVPFRYTVRTIRKWLETAGAPLCPVEGHGLMDHDPLDTDGDDPEP